MSTRITTQPVPITPGRRSSELEYDLGAEDFVACWRFLASKSPDHLPKCVHDELKCIVFCCHFVIAVAFLFLALTGLFFESQAVARISSLVGLLSLVLGAVLVTVRPGLYLEGFLAKPIHRVCMSSLRHLARQEAKKGRTALMDVISHYRFVMNRGGFIHEAKYQQRCGGNPITIWKRRDEIAWRMVEVAGSTEQHVFFIVRHSIPVIVPRSCFADDSSFRLFAQLAKYYHEGRGAFMPRSGHALDNEPGLSLPPLHAVTRGPDDRFVP